MHGGKSKGTTCVVDRDVTAYMVVLLECPKYSCQRTELMNFLVSHPQIYEPIVIADSDLLCGNPELSDQNNKILLSAVARYIISSKRFDQISDQA